MTEQDDTLVLLFMCCHPALTPSSAIALEARTASLPERNYLIMRAARLSEEGGLP